MDDIRYTQALIALFCEERDWDQFHTNKELVIGLVTEASELLQLTRFKSDLECVNLASSVEFRDEIGDVMFFLLRLCQRNGIDLLQVTKNKLEKTKIKYPVDKHKGSNKKYNEK